MEALKIVSFKKALPTLKEKELMLWDPGLMDNHGSGCLPLTATVLEIEKITLCWNGDGRSGAWVKVGMQRRCGSVWREGEGIGERSHCQRSSIPPFHGPGVHCTFQCWPQEFWLYTMQPLWMWEQYPAEPYLCYSIANRETAFLFVSASASRSTGRPTEPLAIQ